MKLQRLTDENMHKLNNKTICCFEKSIAYLEELCGMYDILDSISCVVDTNQRNLGSFLFQGKELMVYDLNHLTEIDWNETVLLITSDYQQEAYEKLSDFFRESKEDMTIFYFANKETSYEEEYRTLYKEHELENIIVFRSGPHASAYIEGTDFADNARALFEYLLANRYNEKYELVWLVKNPKDFTKYSSYKNVSFLSFDWSVAEKKEERDQYYRVLCLAKYLFFTDAYGFARNCRSDQVRLQLWHGCGFKTRVNFVRCEKRYDYTTVISDLYADIHEKIYGLRSDQLLITGYAKEDWLFKPLNENGRKMLDIPNVDKHIFWLPTFRTADKNLSLLNEYQQDTDTGLPIVNTRQQMEELNELLARERIALIIKLHPFQDKSMVHCDDYSNIRLLDNHELVEQDVQINELLSKADALISDYSSAAVDYMLLDRPMAFMLEDVEEYEASRGFVFDDIKAWLPGKEIFEFREVCEFVEEIAKGVDSTREKRQKLKKIMHKFNDGNSCQRIADTLGISL